MEIVILILLVAGNLLAIPIWIWLFGAPLLELCRWIQRRAASVARRDDPESVLGADRYHVRPSDRM
ncbi:MAG: hypothetical protein AB7O66_24700 [Limisphaerales bacterium]